MSGARSEQVDTVSDARARPRVAVLGMGRMGAAMAKRLAERGFPLAVYNRNAERAQSVASETGAVPTPTPADAARWAAGNDRPGIVITSLADDAACRAVYLGENGLAGALAPGTVVCDTSTISPELARELHSALTRCGASFLNSPVSGSVPAALTGGLTVMIGGDPAALETARPALRAIGSTVAHVGGPGSGAVVKLAEIQLIPRRIDWSIRLKAVLTS